MDRRKTNRGFTLITFEDIYSNKCSIQKSSLASESALWIGIDRATPKMLASDLRTDLKGWVDYPMPEGVYIQTRMHINIEQAKEIIEVLQLFVKTGDIDRN